MTIGPLFDPSDFETIFTNADDLPTLEEALCRFDELEGIERLAVWITLLVG